MISVIHADADELIEAEGEFLIPAGGRRMEMDWERVTAAFQSAVERLGWDADLEIRPEKQYVMVRVPRAHWKRVVATTSDFYSMRSERSRSCRSGLISLRVSHVRSRRLPDRGA